MQWTTSLEECISDGTILPSEGRLRAVCCSQLIVVWNSQVLNYQKFCKLVVTLELEISHGANIYIIEIIKGYKSAFIPQAGYETFINSSLLPYSLPSHYPNQNSKWLLCYYIGTALKAAGIFKSASFVCFVLFFMQLDTVNFRKQSKEK